MLSLGPQSPAESPQTACGHRTKITPQEGDGAPWVARCDPGAAQALSPAAPGAATHSDPGRAPQRGRESPRALLMGTGAPVSPPSPSRAVALCKAPRAGMLRGTPLSQRPPSRSPPLGGSKRSRGAQRPAAKPQTQRSQFKRAKFKIFTLGEPSTKQHPAARKASQNLLHIYKFRNSQPAAKATSSQSSSK